jgi:hypothetical protein
VIVVRIEIDVDQSFVGQVLVLYFIHLLHFIIIYTDKVLAAYVFINKEVARYFADDLEIHTTIVRSVRLRINNSLRPPLNGKTDEKKK